MLLTGIMLNDIPGKEHWLRGIPLAQPVGAQSSHSRGDPRSEGGFLHSDVATMSSLVGFPTRSSSLEAPTITSSLGSAASPESSSASEAPADNALGDIPDNLAGTSSGFIPSSLDLQAATDPLPQRVQYSDVSNFSQPIQPSTVDIEAIPRLTSTRAIGCASSSGPASNSQGSVSQPLPLRPSYTQQLYLPSIGSAHIGTGTAHNNPMHIPGVWHMSPSGPAEPDPGGCSNKVNGKRPGEEHSGSEMEPKIQRTRVKKTPEQQRADRRERNRRHARVSRARKKLLIDALQTCIKSLQSENETLKSEISRRFGTQTCEELIAAHTPTTAVEPIANEPPLVSEDASQATTLLENADLSLIKALQSGHQNFVITDPRRLDNPIVYASAGFLRLTQYSLEEVLGRNCRFIQGPETNQAEVQKLGKAIKDGTDVSVCILNYRVDGSTFWNQVHVAPLHNGVGEIVNFVGVQCEVSQEIATLSRTLANSPAVVSRCLVEAGDAGKDDMRDYDDENVEEGAQTNRLERYGDPLDSVRDGTRNAWLSKT